MVRCRAAFHTYLLLWRGSSLIPSAHRFTVAHGPHSPRRILPATRQHLAPCVASSPGPEGASRLHCCSAVLLSTEFLLPMHCSSVTRPVFVWERRQGLRAHRVCAAAQSCCRQTPFQFAAPPLFILSFSETSAGAEGAVCRDRRQLGACRSRSCSRSAGRGRAQAGSAGRAQGTREAGRPVGFQLQARPRARRCGSRSRPQGSQGRSRRGGQKGRTSCRRGCGALRTSLPAFPCR